MLKQHGVLIEAIYNLGKRDYIFTGKRLLDTDKVQEPPGVNLIEIDSKVHIRECHIDGTYKFSEDGRVYDEFSEGYIIPNIKNAQPTVQVMINRTILNIPEDFIRYYATTTDTKGANKLLEEAMVKISLKTDKEVSKREKVVETGRRNKLRESQSERYHYHTKTEGLILAHTPYILTEEGRVYDTELGRLRAVNNRGYTINLYKGLTEPMNLSIENIKNILENKDFTILLGRANYTEDQCNDMWESYQKTLTKKEDAPKIKEGKQTDPEIDEVAEKSGFIRTEDVYYIHKIKI